VSDAIEEIMALLKRAAARSRKMAPTA